ncbi:MAG: saccharopine dehydrogenase C-terminal domain-containing protein, partial [Thiohalocapsa sp.]
LKVLENVGMTRIDPVQVKGCEIAPIEFLKAVLPDPGSLGPLTKGRTCIGCVLRGTKDGEQKGLYVYNICEHEAAFREVGSQAISYTTGVPAMIGAMMMLTGKWMRPGVHHMESFEPDPFMAALGRHGLPWTEIKL